MMRRVYAAVLAATMLAVTPLAANAVSDEAEPISQAVETPVAAPQDDAVIHTYGADEAVADDTSGDVILVSPADLAGGNGVVSRVDHGASQAVRPATGLLGEALNIDQAPHTAGVTPAATGSSSISGRVIIPSGVSASRVTVTATNSATYEQRTVSVDSAGRYSITSLPAGTFTVQASATDDYDWDGINVFPAGWGGGASTSGLPFDLGTAESVSTIDIVLPVSKYIYVKVMESKSSTGFCVDVVAVDDSFTTYLCNDRGYTDYPATWGIPVPDGSYVVDAYELRGSRDTDFAYWVSNSAFTWSRSAATPVRPSTRNEYRDSSDRLTRVIRTASLTTLGTDSASVYALSVAPGMVAGSPSSISVSVSGSLGTASGWVELFDSYGYVDTHKLDGAGKTTFTFSPSSLYATYSVLYRGDSRYQWSTADAAASYAPSVLSTSPAWATEGYSGSFAALGENLSYATAVTVGGTQIAASGSEYAASAALAPMAAGVYRVGAISNGSPAIEYPGAVFNVLKASQTVALGTPERAFDLRSAQQYVPYCFNIALNSGVPEGAEAVIVNVTTANPAGGGNVVLYPDTDGYGSMPAPAASTVNFEKGRDVANSAVVALTANNTLCAYVRGSNLGRLIIDVSGFIVPGSGITTQTSQRLLDTRYAGQIVGPVPGNTTRTVQVTGNAGVPAGATAILANVTVTKATTGGHLKLWAGNLDEPRSSVINYAPGQDKANAAIIGLAPDGTMNLRSVTSGTAQIIIDVVGYVDAVSDYTPVTPTRVLDTRPGGSHVGTIPGALNTSNIYSFEVSDTDLIPADADAVVLNVTAAAVRHPGHLTVYPDTDGNGQTTPPYASTINYIPGRDVPNLVIVQLPANRHINLKNHMSPTTGTTNVVIDIVGYISAGNPS